MKKVMFVLRNIPESLKIGVAEVSNELYQKLVLAQNYVVNGGENYNEEADNAASAISAGFLTASESMDELESDLEKVMFNSIRILDESNISTESQGITNMIQCSFIM